MPSASDVSFSSVSCCLLPFVCIGAIVQSVLLTCIGVAKGVIVLLPVAVLTIPTWLLATVANWPSSLVATYITVAVTQRLGPNLRALALLLMPVPLLVWPVATAIASLMFTFSVGFFWPLWATVALGSLFEGEKVLHTAVIEPMGVAKTCAVEVWKFSSGGYFTYLEELRRPYYGEPLDVSMLRLLISVLLSLMCSFLGTAAVLCLGLLRLPFIIARSLGEWMALLNKCPPKLMCLWLPFWVVGIPAIPIVAAFLFLLVLIGNFLYLGPTCGVVAYLETSSRPAHRSFTWALFTALDVLYAHIYALDEAGVRLTGLGSSTLLPVPSQRVDGRRIPYVGSTARTTQPGPPDAASPAGPLMSPQEQAWATFEDICGASVQRALRWGWVPRADLADSEAYLFIGLPAVALLQLLADAAAVPPDWMPDDGKGAGGDSAGKEGEGGEGGAASAAAGGGEAENKQQKEKQQGEQQQQRQEASATGGVGDGLAGSAGRTDAPSGVTGLAMALPPLGAEVAAAPGVSVVVELAGVRGAAARAAVDGCSGGDDGNVAAAAALRSIPSDAGSVILHDLPTDGGDEGGVPAWRDVDVDLPSVSGVGSWRTGGGGGGEPSEGFASEVVTRTPSVAQTVLGPQKGSQRDPGSARAAAAVAPAGEVEAAAAAACLAPCRPLCCGGAATSKLPSTCQRGSPGRCCAKHDGGQVCPHGGREAEAEAGRVTSPPADAVDADAAPSSECATAAEAPSGGCAHVQGAAVGEPSNALPNGRGPPTAAPAAAAATADGHGAAGAETEAVDADVAADAAVDAAGVGLGAEATASAAPPAASVSAPGVIMALPFGHEQLDPAVAQLLLEELAEHVLSADIGFTSAANPVRLHKSLAALQATPLEMRYMACHTVLLGDPRVGELVPLGLAPASQPTGTGTGHTGTTPSSGAFAAPTSSAAVAAPSPVPAGRRGGNSRPASGPNMAPMSPLSPGGGGGGATRPNSGGALRLFGHFSRDSGAPATGTAGGGASAPNSPPLATNLSESQPAAATAATTAVHPATAPLLPPRHHRRGRSSLGGSSAGAVAASAAALSCVVVVDGGAPAAAEHGSEAGKGAGSALGGTPCSSTLPHPQPQPEGTAPATLPVPSDGDVTGAATAGAGAGVLPRGDSVTVRRPAGPAAALPAGADVVPAGATSAAAAAEASTDASGAVVVLGPAVPQGVALSGAAKPSAGGSLHGRSLSGAPSAPPTPSLHIIVSTSNGASSSAIPTVHPPPPGGVPAPTHHQPGSSSGGHRWPFGKGRHRRTRSQPVGMPAGALGLVPPSPRSVPGVEAPDSTAALAAAATAEIHAHADSEAGGLRSHGVTADGYAHSTAGNAAAAGEAGAPGSSALPGAAAAVSQQRVAQLHAFTAAVQSVATALSKKARMKEIMGRLLVKYGTGGSVCGDEGGQELRP